MDCLVDIIWAKTKYGKFWPARLSKTPKNLQTPQKCVYVCFFGSENNEFVQLDFVKSYLKHRSTFVNRCNSKEFKEAVRVCDELCSKQSQSFNEISKEEEREMICTECAEKDARIKHLLSENGHLKEKIEALENTISNSIKSRRQSISKKHYEVECLLDDKIVRGKRKFLVHWKDFESEHDTWENEHNLNCPDILRDYLSAKDTKSK